jgi:hypothetical protein
MGAAALLISVGAKDYAAAKERSWWTVLVAVAITAVVLRPVNRIFWAEVEEHVNEAPPESSIGLAPGERAVWTGSSTSVPRFLVGALLVAASLVAAWFWTPLFLMGLIGLNVLVTSRQFVVIDHRGLSMRRWTHRYVLNLELARIASATVGNKESLVKQITRLEWGFQENDDRTTTFGHRSRSGPTIEVRLVNMDVHSVSVDDAEEAADVLNALVARHRLAQGSESDVVQATSPSDRSG